MSIGFKKSLNKYTATGDKIDLTKDLAFSQKSLIGTRGNTIANALYSQSELANEIQARAKALGPQRGGMVMLGEDGKPLANHRFYSHELKKWTTTDDEGRVIMGNKQLVNEAYKLYIEREELIDEYCEKCCVNDEICAYVLGFANVAGLTACLAKGNAFEVDGVELKDPALVTVDAMPSSMRRYAHNSSERLAAVQKLRLLVGERLNYINLIDYGGDRSDVHDENVQNNSVKGEFKLGGDAKVIPK